MIDDRHVRDECERAVKNLIDDAVMPIRLIDRGHDENDLDAVAAADGVDGLHLMSNLLLVTRPQRPFGLLQCILVLNERRAGLRPCDKLRTVATERTRPEAGHAAKTSVGAEPRLQHDWQAAQPGRGILVTVRGA